MRYFVETTTEEEHSSSFSSDQEGHGKGTHLRDDMCSSAEDENALKEMFRRNAREDYYARKDAEKIEADRKRDFKIIGKCRFERIPIPDELLEKYKDELTDYRENTEQKI